MTAEEAAMWINHGDTVAFSGFTPSGAAKAVPKALAARARHEHGQGKDFRLRVLTGASSGPCIDEQLAAAGAIMWRAPYQTGDSLRRYVSDARPGHIRHDLLRCFELHRNLIEHGSMLPDGI